MKNEKNYYIGLDIGTDSVGYAVTDEKYNLLKFHGEPAWGTTIFEPGALCSERRNFRTARRRLDRRQQRVLLLQELFASEIGKIDERFFIRQQESRLYRDETEDDYILFVDEEYTDQMYYEQYPTIHHLICELMNNSKPHDIRLVYLACSWLVAHRGHFLSTVSKNNIEKIKDFNVSYENLMAFFYANGYDAPWDMVETEEFENVLRKKESITEKIKALVAVLYNGKKPSREITDSFPFDRDAIVRLLAGGTCKVKDIFDKAEYEELGSISLGMEEDKLNEILANLGDDADLIVALRNISDWSVLVDVLGDYVFISESKVAVYEKHKADLADLKYIVRKYVPHRYHEVFRAQDGKKPNYTSYVYHTNDGDTSKLKKAKIEDFSKYIMSILKEIKVEEQDEVLLNSMMDRLAMHTFLPKQKTTDNRVIPHQLYWVELNRILENASKYLPFLNECDEKGISVKEKIMSVFLFKIPYYVGPLNEQSDHAWIVRKAGKIYPWNFEEMVDLDASEGEFIRRLTNHCTYIPGEPVLPRDSLLYQKFTVLNEINNIRIAGKKLSVECKRNLYNELFMNMKKITKKRVVDYFMSNGVIEKGDEESVTGIDVNLTANLTSQIAFKRLLSGGVLSVNDVERIIERASYAEDKSRLKVWLEKEYPSLDSSDIKYICSLKIREFGRLSRAFLCDLEGASKNTGEVMTIIGALWNTQDNLMELLSDRYTFMESIEEIRRKYYAENPMKLSERLEELCISNSVKRSIYRTLAVVKDVEKAFGIPKKIFIETTRDSSADQKGKRTKSRLQQVLDLYRSCQEEDIRLLKQQLEAMGEYAENKLQGDKLFLYYMQLGKCMYTGESIELEKLGTKLYDIDHIYPQALVKDDSIINNKVLILSVENGKKSNVYPIDSSIRHKMTGYWTYLLGKGLISSEKYRRLVRSTPFTEEEKWGFINRQLTETSQAAKATAAILKERFPETEIVYSKAGLVSDFRQEFEIYKSRIFNDLHHAVDAYLNIVVGNVYNMKFTKKWFHVNSDYSIKPKSLFTKPLICNGATVWGGEEALALVKKTAVKNNAHFTKYAYYKRGGLFDQLPVAKSEGLVPLKKGMPTEKYGGYNKAGAMFYIPVRYETGKKNEIIIMSVEMLYGPRFLKDEAFAVEYSFKRLESILGKPVKKVSFPMGMRPWKVNTVLSLDGFRVCIAGIGGGGKCLIAQPCMQFSESAYWQYYLKKLERFVEKITKNVNYCYDADYDKVCKDKNLELYDIYIKKYQSSVFRKRVNPPTEILENGREQFEKLDIQNQCKALLNIHATFGRVSGGCDLQLIGGSPKAAATVNFSSTISNWKKRYSEVRIIDSSVAGLWEKRSMNLFELL